MVGLPANGYPPGGLYHTSYEKCLEFERHCLPSDPSHKPCESLIAARFLGFMIIEAPTDDSRSTLSVELRDCTDEEALRRLARLYIDHFLCCFKSNNGPTPAPSHHPSRPSFDATQETITYLLQEPTPSHASAKTLALIRDGYRCMLTGAVDVHSFKNIPHLAQTARLNHWVARYTQCAHVFAQSTNAGISGGNTSGAKCDYAGSMWTVMSRFSGQFDFQDLNGNDIHRLENVMTMSFDVHQSFDQLHLWLEQTSNPHRYLVCTREDYFKSSFGLPDYVTFTSSDPRLVLPSPAYLRLHAACARVAHLSGAGEYTEKMLKDFEEIRVLAKDGSSADLLKFALTALSVY